MIPLIKILLFLIGRNDFHGFHVLCAFSGYFFVKLDSIYVDAQLCMWGPRPGLLLLIRIVKSKCLKVRKSRGAGAKCIFNETFCLPATCCLSVIVLTGTDWKQAVSTHHHNQKWQTSENSSNRFCRKSCTIPLLNIHKNVDLSSLIILTHQLKVRWSLNIK